MNTQVLDHNAGSYTNRSNREGHRAEGSGVLADRLIREDVPVVVRQGECVWIRTELERKILS